MIRGPISNDEIRPKRLKLRNAVVAEMVEAIRYLLLQTSEIPSQTIATTIENNIKTIIKYSRDVWKAADFLRF